MLDQEQVEKIVANWENQEELEILLVDKNVTESVKQIIREKIFLLTASKKNLNLNLNVEKETVKSLVLKELRDNQSVFAHEIVTKYKLGRSSVSKAVSKLEEAGELSRLGHQDDKRSFLLSRTILPSLPKLEDELGEIPNGRIILGKGIDNNPVYFDTVNNWGLGSSVIRVTSHRNKGGMGKTTLVQSMVQQFQGYQEIDNIYNFDESCVFSSSDHIQASIFEAFEEAETKVIVFDLHGEEEKTVIETLTNNYDDFMDSLRKNPTLVIFVENSEDAFLGFHVMPDLKIVMGVPHRGHGEVVVDGKTGYFRCYHE